METCQNCQRQIGNLEDPFLWKLKVVCAECHARLSYTNNSRQVVATKVSSVPVAAVAVVTVPQFRCSRCHRVSEGVAHRRSQQVGVSQGIGMIGNDIGFSETEHFAMVDVCPSCANQIDVKAKRDADFATIRKIVIVVVGAIIIAVLLYTLSKTI